jgi:RNA polymerase sigma factor (sigma-70 family)
VIRETFLRAYESISRFTWVQEDSLFVWLASIAEHLILNATKKRKLSRLQIDRIAPDSGASPSRILRRKERSDRLASARNHLTPDQKKAIILVPIEGFPAKEIARRMDRSDSDAKPFVFSW